MISILAALAAAQTTGVAIDQPVADTAAQAAPKERAASEGLTDIVVTAQKRAESLQDTPISISALDAHALETKRIASLTDLTSAVPNMQVSPHPNTGTTLRVTIRGIGDPAATQTRDNPVAVYVDGVYVAKGQGLANELAELERVEVLRGPQGTLYGRNATAGAINFITRPPELGEFSAQQNLSFGSFNEFRSRTSVNIPIGDVAAVDFTYVRAKKNGLVRNLGAGAKRFGDVDRNAIRTALRWQVSDNFEARYAYDSSWIEDTSPYAQQVPFYPAEGKLVREGTSGAIALEPSDTHVQGHNLTLTYDFGPDLTIKSITGYRRLSDFTTQIYNPAAPALPIFPFGNTSATRQKQFSEEIQLIGDAFDNSLKYVGGLYYFEESGSSFDHSEMPGSVNPRSANWDNKAYAVFGQATWTPKALDERLHVTLGARWSKDERQAGVFSTRTAQGGPTVVLLDAEGKRSFNDFSPTATVQFDINDDVNIYAKATKGYRTGGFNPTASSQKRFTDGFGPESLLSYESGIKSEFFDRRVRFNLAAYYSKYKDIQTNVFDPFNPRIFDIINAGRAVTKGIEADLTVLVVEGLTVNGSYGYTDPKYKKVVDLGGNDVTSNFHFQHAPKHSFTLGADYRSPETPIGIVEANLGYAWQDKYQGVASDPTIITHSYGLLSGRIGLTDIGGKEGLRIALWGRNLTNTTYYLNHFSIAGSALAMFGEPRSWGVDIGMKF